MATLVKPVRAALCWECDSRDILREWPKNIRGDFNTALDAMQDGQKTHIPTRHAIHRPQRFLN